ncbi:MAG: phosphatase PAP2 family protein [Candidatus Zixiibacteriota bacterium]
MLESLQAIDLTLFRFINDTLANPVTDFIMPIITSDWNLRIIYAVAMILLLWRGSKETRWIVGFSIVAMLIADQLASGFLKELIKRERPCQTLDAVHLLVNCGSGKSMPSSHATNAFAQAAFFCVSFRKHGWWLFLFAALVAISRVFVGVHYPADILVGALLGSMVGVAIAWLNSALRRSKGNSINGLPD